MGKIIMELEAPPLVTRDESSSSAFGKTTRPLHQQTTASTTRSSGSRRQRVSFGSDDTPVKVVVHCYSYCDNDDDNDNAAPNDTDDSSSNATWYSNQEFQEMRRETYAKIKLYRHHYFHNDDEDEEDEDDDWTWRGFEYVITRHPRKHLRREHVINVVYFQKVLGTMTETAAVALADYASNMTFANGSAFRARSLAIRDEMEACDTCSDTQQFENEDEETSSTSSSCSSLVVVDAPKTIPMSTATRGKPSSQRHRSTHSHGSTVGPASPWIKMRQFFRCI